MRTHVVAFIYARLGVAFIEKARQRPRQVFAQPGFKLTKKMSFVLADKQPTVLSINGG
jgi:hypothetical protein